MRACELCPDTSASQVLVGGAEMPVGSIAVGQESPRPRVDPERPGSSGRACLPAQPGEGVLGNIGPPGSRCRLHQFAQTPVLGDNLPVLAGGVGGRERVFIGALAVAQDGARVLADGYAD